MNELICQICNRIAKNKGSLFIHISGKHKICKKDYYDQYLKQPNDGICLGCNKEVKWIKSSGKYSTYCSITCFNKSKDRIEARKKTINSHINRIKPTIEDFIRAKIDIDKIDRFGCLFCKNKFSSIRGVSFHLKLKHNIDSKEYFDYFYKTEQDGICKTCKASTKWIKDSGTYKIHCNRSCAARDPNTIKIKEDNAFIKYGTKNINSLPSKIENMKQTCVERYGTNCSLHNYKIHKKVLKTWKRKYGVEQIGAAKEVIQKRKTTLIKRYGFEDTFSSPIIRERSRLTMQLKYGVNYAMQNYDSHQKNINSCYKTKPYILPSGIKVNKQGYEPQFLTYIFKNNLLTENEIIYHPKTIKYINKSNTSSYYHPDFYIPKYNLIVEIKSTWTEKLDKNMLLKEQACIDKGYKYIRIVDNKFDKFVEFINITNN